MQCNGQLRKRSTALFQQRCVSDYRPRQVLGGQPTSPLGVATANNINPTSSNKGIVKVWGTHVTKKYEVHGKRRRKIVGP